VQGVFSAARGVLATRGVRLNGIVSTCAYVSAYVSTCACVSAYVGVRVNGIVSTCEIRQRIRQQMSACVSIRESFPRGAAERKGAYTSSVRAHTLVPQGRIH
jgi:hypothetical protein